MYSLRKTLSPSIAAGHARASMPCGHLHRSLSRTRKPRSYNDDFRFTLGSFPNMID